MKVVLLLGPSSAGKSTTCDALNKAHGWRVSSGDAVMDSLFEKAKNDLRVALQAKGLFTALQHIMTEDAVVDLCIRGLLNISKGDHLIQEHKCNSAKYPGMAERLTEAGFSETEKQTLLPLLKSAGETFIEFEEQNKFPDLADALLDDVFDKSVNLNETVVIDHIPVENGRTEKFLENFNARVEKYRTDHGVDSIESHVVLACCPPQQLSERIIGRNRAAEASGDEKNKREGTFPFTQLGALVRVGIFQEAQNNRVGQISRDELIGIAHRHQRPERDESPDLSSEGVANSIVSSLVKSVFEYSDLSEQYAVGREVAMQDLVVRPQFESYPRINTAVGTPAELAQQVIQLTEAESVNRLRM